jgi:hypothetical protein
VSALYVAEYLRLLAEMDAAEEAGDAARSAELADRLDGIYRHLSGAEVDEIEAHFAGKNGEKERKESAT